MDSEEISSSRQEEPTSGLNLDLNVALTQEPSSGLKSTSCMQLLPNDAEPLADNCCRQNVDGDNQGVIRLNNLHRRAETAPVPTHKEKRRWLCQQFGLVARCKRQSNFLNLTEEEMEGIKSRNEILATRKEAQFRKMFSSYITGIVGDEGITKEMNELVAKHDHMLAKKRWGLHERWHKQVFKTINEQVENKLKTLTSDQIKDKIRYFHYQYMNASNHRLLFLDILDNTYYNPFESLKYSIKYTNNFHDPLKHDLDKAKYETFIKDEIVSKDVKTRETLDASKWYYSMFRSTIWGHLNADEEDGSQVAVKDLEKWNSHDVLYNSKFVDTKFWEEEFPRGKHVVPNQGKGWSFRSKQEGKGKVYGLEFMTQPKLQFYYT